MQIKTERVKFIAWTRLEFYRFFHSCSLLLYCLNTEAQLIFNLKFEDIHLLNSCLQDVKSVVYIVYTLGQISCPQQKKPVNQSIVNLSLFVYTKALIKRKLMCYKILYLILSSPYVNNTNINFSFQNQSFVIFQITWQ